MAQSQIRSVPAVEAWVLAARPKTLLASVVPVLLGLVLAAGDNMFRLPVAAAVLCAAVLIQIGCNFANDAIDFERGSDTAERLGPTRATQAGYLSARTMKLGALIALGLALALGCYLVSIGGIAILAIGVASLISAVLYSAGKYALAYTGLAELFVLVFFGPVAVAGTYFLFAKTVTPASILIGVSCGAISTAILAINNLRDIESDRKAQKLTLAVRWGERFARREYLLLLLCAAAAPLITAAIDQDHPWSALAAAYILFAAAPIRTVSSGTRGAVLNEVLEQTAKLLAIFGALFILGYFIPS